MLHSIKIDLCLTNGRIFNFKGIYGVKYKVFFHNNSFKIILNRANCLSLTASLQARNF